jgi:ComF family protein
MLQAIVNLLFVPHCAACDVRVEPGAALCAICELSLYELGAACPRCAEPLPEATLEAWPEAKPEVKTEAKTEVPCARCRAAPPPFSSAHAPYRYGGELAWALQRLKYDGRADIARTLAPLLAPALARVVAQTGVDLAVPVPLHWRRLSSRGFNQAALLLGHAARGLALEIDRTSLRRVRATAAQSGLRGGQRAGNVASAFAVPRGRRARVAGRRVLCVDDVMTTGATLGACARALLAAGAREIVVFCAARAERW